MNDSTPRLPEQYSWLRHMPTESDTVPFFSNGTRNSPAPEVVKEFLLALQSLSHCAAYELSINGQKNNGSVDLKLHIELPQEMVFAFLASANGSFRDFTLTANTATKIGDPLSTSQFTNTR